MSPARYDVFISYNRADQPDVLKLATLLKERGVKVWLDVWNLVAGEPWLPAVERALRDSSACAVMVGPHGLGGVHEHEMWTAIEQSLSSPQGPLLFRVFPVLLPHSTRGDRSRLPSFLTRHTWIEFQKSLDEPAVLDAFARAIRGEPPSQVSSVPHGECPYRGLAHFDIGDAPLFFGREALTDWLLSRLRGTATKEGPTRFLAIVGASGSGKSSLARAGLLAQLKQAKLTDSARWPLVVCRPESRPLESLAAALANAEGIQLGTGLKSDLIAQLETSLRNSPDGLHKLVLANRPADDPDWRLVIFVDQFEELFTLNSTSAVTPTTAVGTHLESDRIAYVKNLLNSAMIADGRTIVILTMRADFYGKCAAIPELATAVSQHQELVGPMSADELRRAIELPAQLSGRDIESGLVDLLVREVAQQPGALPLLQYALAELWKKSSELGSAKLTMAAYRELGGWEGALSRRADAVLAEFKNTPQEKLCRELFLRLVQPGEGTEDTKRLVRWEELKRVNKSEAEALEQTVRKLADNRLITTGGEIQPGETLDGNATVEVVHEALIRGWGELRNWLETNRAGLRTHRQLTDAANEWGNSHSDIRKRDPSLLYTGTRLATAVELTKRDSVTLNEVESQFLDTSTQAVRDRKRRTLFSWVGTAVAIALLAIVGTLIAVNNQNNARAREMVENLKNAKESQVPEIVKGFDGYRRWANQPLQQLFTSADAESSAKLHAALALAPVKPVDGGVIGHLRERLLNATPAQFPLIRDALANDDPERATQIEKLWQTSEVTTNPMGQRFQAACALATFTPEDARWTEVAPAIAKHLTGLPAAEAVAWRTELRPARHQFQQPLAAIFRASPKESQLRQFSAETLTDFASDNGKLIGELLLEADPATFELLLAAGTKTPADLKTRLQQELDETLKPQWDDAPLDPTWKAIDRSLADKIEKEDGAIDERFAICLSLPVAELVDMCEALRPTGYRPISVVTWSRGDDILAAVVWTRDGANWQLHGPIDPETALSLDTRYQAEALRPVLVDRVPPTGLKVYVLWNPPNAELRDSTTGAAGEARLQHSELDTDIPVSWLVKYHRFEPDETGRPPSDWSAAVSGAPFRETKSQQLNINRNAEAKQFQNVLIDAKGSVTLEQGTYQIWSHVDDGVRVHVDDKLVLDRWTDNDKMPASVRIFAEAGPHVVRVEHFQTDGELVLKLKIKLLSVALASSGSNQTTDAASGKSLFESNTVVANEPTALGNELRKLFTAGFRPFSVSDFSQPGQPVRVDVICRRPMVADDARDGLARRQSHASVALARLGQVDELWPRMAFNPDPLQPPTQDPRLRTELIHDLADYRADSKVLFDRLGLEQDVSTRRALILALGQYPPDQLPADQRQALIEKLLVDYENEPDSGLHGAVEWLLRKWDRADDVHRIVDRLTPTDKAPQGHRAMGDRQWYLNGRGQTFTVLSPGQFLMGTPETEPDRQDDERRHLRQIERPFAITSTEVTRKMYLAFVKATGARDPANPFVKTLDSPQTGMEWFEAARYCNWLSEQEGIDRDQWCFDPNEKGEYGPGMRTKQGFLDLAGYRLPTEAEWEYACRAGSATSRYYGISEVRLREFAWYLDNGNSLTHPVGEKKPNDAGLFDMLGNAIEWCHDAGYAYPVSPGVLTTLTDQSANMDASLSRVLRGASFDNRASLVRSGYRGSDRPGDHDLTLGFRPARTYR